MRLYRLIILVLSPLISARFLARLIAGRESREGLAQRLGYGGQPTKTTPTIWLHGASLGELAAARSFLQHLLKEIPHLSAVVTCNTYTARHMVQAWRDPRIHACLAPLDSPAIVSRFLNTWQPRVTFTLENEIWPARILSCQKRAIPVVVLGGRMSAKSAAMWQRFGGLANRVMAAITVLAPLDSENAARFASIGLAAQKIATPVNLKSTVQLPAPDPDHLSRFAKIFDRNTTILAASTHAGEEEIILTAFQTARAQYPELRLIIAPRHPDRADAIARAITRSGLRHVRRSTGENIDHPVYLADTIGEMSLWYSLARLTIVGGSLVDKGGHTPVEPVQFGSIVLHGPHVANHAAAYSTLSNASAAFCVHNARELAEIIGSLIGTAASAHIPERARAALKNLYPDRTSPQALLARLDELSQKKLSAALRSHAQLGQLINQTRR